MSRKVHEDIEYLQFCTFRLDGRLFGVNIIDVKEINYETTCTPIAHATKAVKGYLNLRGQINLILCLRTLLGFEAKEADSDSSVILFKPTVGENFGVMVDKIGDIVEVASDQIEERRVKRSVRESERQGESAEFQRIIATDLTKGICKLENELMVVLDSHKILPTISRSNTEKAA